MVQDTLTANAAEGRADDGDSDDAVVCSSCHDEFDRSDTHALPHGSSVCDDCFEEHYVTCERCDDVTLRDDARRMAHDEYWCDSCYESHGDYCNGCDAYYPDDEISYDLNDNGYCGNCQENDYGTWTERYDNETIHEYDTDIFDVLPDGRPDAHDLCFGFELELNTHDGQDRWDAARTFLQRSGQRGIVKCDGSIGDGDSGIELVSLPMRLADLRALVNDILPGNNLHPTAFADSSCGLHVHVSRNPLTLTTLAKLVRFVHSPDNLAFIEYLAGRRLIGSRYAAIDCRTASWKALYQYPPHFGDGQRYAALNFCNFDTVEFRIFRATTDASRVCASIEACAALVAFCSPATTSLAVATSHAAFIGYVQQQQRTFPHLARLLSAYSRPASPAFA